MYATLRILSAVLGGRWRSLLWILLGLFFALSEAPLWLKIAAFAAVAAVLIARAARRLGFRPLDLLRRRRDY